jgi:hypothetical protein
VPQSRLWDCQTPAPQDAGQWVVVSANMILDAHNCTWLFAYPHESLARGTMYAFHLPGRIPPEGAPGGPPLPSARHQFLGSPVDARVMYLDLVRHPETLPQIVEKMKAGFAEATRRH